MVSATCKMDELADAPMVTAKTLLQAQRCSSFCHHEGVGRDGVGSVREKRKRGHHSAIAPPSSGDPIFMASSEFNQGKLAST